MLRSNFPPVYDPRPESTLNAATSCKLMSDLPEPGVHRTNASGEFECAGVQVDGLLNLFGKGVDRIAIP